MSNYHFDVMTKEEIDRELGKEFEILEWDFVESGYSIKIAHNNRFYGLWNFQNGYLYGSWEIRQFNNGSPLRIDQQTMSPMVSELYDWIQQHIRQNIKTSTDKEMVEILRRYHEDEAQSELRKFEEQYKETARKIEEQYKETARKIEDDFRRMVKNEEKRARYS